MKKRIISAVLLVSLLLTLCACVGAEAGGESGGTTSAQDGSFFGYEPKNKGGYGGKTVNFMTHYANESYNMQIDPYSREEFDETKASTVISAVAERTKLVEEALDVDIKETVVVSSKRTGGGEAYDAVIMDIQGGLNEYDVIMPCLRDAALLAQDGKLIDLNKLEGLDLTNEWWSQRFNQDTAIDGKVFFTIGDIGYVNKDATMFVAFNKEMVEEQRLMEGTGYKSLYEMVDNKTWTQDVLFRMAKAVYIDSNENNKCDPGDINGIAGQSALVQWMLFASGERIATLDSEKLPIISLYNPRSVNIVDKTQEYISDPKNGYLSANDYFNLSNVPVMDVTVPEFVGGRCLFFIDAVLNMENLRGMKQNFGVLPMPMFDDTQDGYSSAISYWTSDGLCIHNGFTGDTARLAMIADVLEAMGAASRARLVPAYYTQTLQTQISRDQESERMLDIIFAGRTVELADVYDWGKLSTMVVELHSAPQGSFGSSYDSIKDSAQTEIQETIDKYKSLNE